MSHLDQNPPLVNRVLYYFGIIGAVVSAAASVIALAHQSDPGHVVFLRYSMARLWMVLLLLAAFLGFTTFAISFRGPGKHRKLEDYFQKPMGVWSAYALALLMTVIGLGLLSARNAKAGGAFAGYLYDLFSIEIWITAIGLLGLFSSLFLARRTSYKDLFSVAVCVIAIAGASFLYSRVWTLDSLLDEDIYYSFVEGERLVAGKNPYERVLSGDMRTNDKYATYFPGMYYASAVSVIFGLDTFERWIILWRFLFVISGLAIGAIMFSFPFFSGRRLLACFSLLFWLLNRWTFHVIKSTDLDFIPLLFLILSLILLKRQKTFSFLLYGVSLAIKQMGIFLLPMYIFWAWDGKDPAAVRSSFVKNILAIAFFPVIFSIPFLVWNAEGYIHSILFSVTRNSSSLGELRSVDDFLGLAGFPARIPMLLMFLLIFAIAIRRKIPPFLSVFLVFAVFVLFNSNLFTSYVLWMIVWIPLATSEVLLTTVSYSRHALPDS